MTWRRRGFLAVSLGMALTSCAQLASRQPNADAPLVEAREDSSQRFVGFIGPKAQHAPRFLDIPETNFYCLRSFVDRRTGETAHQIVISGDTIAAQLAAIAARRNLVVPAAARAGPAPPG